MLKDKLVQCILFCFCPLFLFAENYPEVVFDNSAHTGNYAKSAVSYAGRSWVENVNGKLPVCDTLFFTPGNSLSLKYISAEQSQWAVDLLYNKQLYNYKLSNKDMLSLRILIKSNGTKQADLPKLMVKQAEGNSQVINLANFMDRYALNTWVTVQIPVKSMDMIQMGQPITALQLQQGEASKQLHQIFIDQVEFLPLMPSKVKLSSAAVLSKVESLDKQVELSWQLPLTPSIRYIKVYRSTDKEHYKALGIYPIFMLKAFDEVPALDRTYYYKIAWVDYAYVESPFSEVKEVKPKAASPSELVDFIQAAHVNYFVNHFDINSGMFLPSKTFEQPIVSVKETGYSLMALIVGAENKYISRRVLLSRVQRIVDFLGKAPHKDGVFPAFFDGRKGQPYYPNNKVSYDVKATSILMESLILCRQYFFKEDEEELQLRNKITNLWRRVNWGSFTKDQKNELLMDSWSPDTEFQSANIIYGLKESLNTYLLGLASPTFPLSDSAYTKGYGTNHLVNNMTQEPRSIFEEYDYEFLDHSVATSKPQLPTSIVADTLVYGEELHLPFSYESLLDIYSTCMTFNPKGKKDQYFDYEKELKTLVTVWKRRDNELVPEAQYADLWGFQYPKLGSEKMRLHPALSISAMAMDKKMGTLALQTLYNQHSDVLFTENGFRAWIDLKNNEISSSYSPLSQAVIAVMIENAKTGLLWKLMAEDPDMKPIYQKFYKK